MIYTIIQLILISIAATSAMTWFSYAMSKNFKELYKEPVLLSFALKKQIQAFLKNLRKLGDG
jgi:type II secretory pathway pseudopilin PulG